MIGWTLILLTSTGGITGLDGFASKEECNNYGDRVAKDAKKIRYSPINHVCLPPTGFGQAPIENSGMVTVGNKLILTPNSKKKK